MQEFTIGFQVHDPILFEDMTVLIEEFLVDQAVLCPLVFDLWIRKGYPYFRNFILRKKLVDQFYLRS